MSLTAISPADAAALAALPDCRYIDLLLPDLNGLLRGKRIRRAALDKAFTNGICLPMSLIATDITGNTVEETGLGYDIGDADRICRPVAGTLREGPWLDRSLAQCLIQMEQEDGSLFEPAPRAVLQRIVERFGAHGLKPVVAIELEFYLLDGRLDPSGQPRAARNPATGLPDCDTQVYYLQDLVDHGNFIERVAESCARQQLPADAAVAEYAPGQFEINLQHRDDALRACDEAVFLKRAVKAAAESLGMTASFMAKPFAERAGCGTHVHVSLLDRDGQNLFSSAPETPSDALRHALGGLRQTAAETLLMLAPHANSYRRFVANAFVPLNECWGYNNRTVALRIPHSDPANRRIEHRVAGADANPYLACAAVLAGILEGLDHAIDPGPPVTGNAYQQTEPRTLYWRDSIASFMNSEFVRQAFGASFQHVFGQQKLCELNKFQRSVTTLEIAWYLRQV